MSAQGGQVIPEYHSGSNGSTSTRPSGIFVFCGIFATFALLLPMLGLLLYRARTQRAPEKALVVQGDERWSGVCLGVEGPGLAEPLVSTLDKSNKYFVAFFLDPGTYLFYVRYGDDYILKPSRVELSDNVDTMGLDLVHSNLKPPVIQPSTRPSTRPAI